jgi:soluble lytic murein transglycosylase-like protein
MRTFCWATSFLGISCLAFAAGPAGKDAGGARPAETPMTLQLRSIAAMKAPLALQRDAVGKRAGRPRAGSFFELSPPAPTPPLASRAERPACEPLSASETGPLIESAAARENLQPELLRAVVKQESDFVPCAVSPKGAVGLMQLMPMTATQLGVRNAFDPKENIDGGARMLRQLLDLYGDLPLALSAYNAGMGRVRADGGVPNIPETQDYVHRILSVLSAR